MKPFDLEKAKAGAKLITRDGREAKNFRKRKERNELDRNPCDFPFSAEVGDEVVTYTLAGSYFTSIRSSEYDLFLADELIK